MPFAPTLCSAVQPFSFRPACCPQALRHLRNISHTFCLPLNCLMHYIEGKGMRSEVWRNKCDRAGETGENRENINHIWSVGHGGNFSSCINLPMRTFCNDAHNNAAFNFRLCKIWGFHGGDYEVWCLLGMLCRVSLVRTDVSEELNATFIRVTRIGELVTILAATSNRRKLRRNTQQYIALFLVTDSCQPDEGGVKFLRNVRSYKSHTA
jgi:hypothetical protein